MPCLKKGSKHGHRTSFGDYSQVGQGSVERTGCYAQILGFETGDAELGQNPGSLYRGIGRRCRPNYGGTLG